MEIGGRLGYHLLRNEFRLRIAGFRGQRKFLHQTFCDNAVARGAVGYRNGRAEEKLGWTAALYCERELEQVLDTFDMFIEAVYAEVEVDWPGAMDDTRTTPMLIFQTRPVISPSFPCQGHRT
jgi:hypothetical protein